MAKQSYQGIHLPWYQWFTAAHMSTRRHGVQGNLLEEQKAL